MKEQLKDYFEQQQIKYVDLGCFSEDPVDYPDVAREVAEKVYEHQEQGARGVLLCGTGLGMCIVANKQKGIRAAAMVNEQMAEMARKHNDANVACLGGRTMDFDLARRVIDVFLKTEFEADERHIRRLGKIER